jgi:hypothetical protein
LFKNSVNTCFSALTETQKSLKCTLLNAGIAQLVERNLAKVEVASSSLVSRSTFILNVGVLNHQFKTSFKYLKLKKLNGECSHAFAVLISALCIITAVVVLHAYGAIAKRLCRGLQSLLARFDSGSRLHLIKPCCFLSATKYFFTFLVHVPMYKPMYNSTITKKLVHYPINAN